VNEYVTDPLLPGATVIEDGEMLGFDSPTGLEIVKEKVDVIDATPVPEARTVIVDVPTTTLVDAVRVTVPELFVPGWL
jgi:hypothetical protein